MPRKVFVSYSHRQGDWVCNRLVPCLKAGGAEVVIDVERMRVGQPVQPEMDALQDTADTTLVVLSQEYLDSGYCRHEMDRALAKDAILPAYREQCPNGLPPAIKSRLYADLRDDRQVNEWDKLLAGCCADLGATAPEWLRARDEVVSLVSRGQSVNLHVLGSPRWRPLIDHVAAEHLPELRVVDLDDGGAVYRAGLVEQILRALGSSESVPEEPKDLGVLSRHLYTRPRSLLALLHFDHVGHRPYGVDLFSALRVHMEARRLVLLAESRTPFAALLPTEHPLSSVEIVTVELRGR